MKERGQVSTFIIVGGVILLLVLLSVLLYSQREGSIFQRGLSDAFSATPEEVVPFVRYVDACTEKLLSQAIINVGVRGGTLYPEDLNLEYNFLEPTEADGVALFDSSDLFVPYWNYIAGDNECIRGCEKRFIPPPLTGDAPASVESQIEKYVEKNLLACIKNKDVFEPTGLTFEPSGEPLADVTIAASDVSLKLQYPFIIYDGDAEYQVSEFSAKSKTPLKRYYEDAVFMASLLNQTSFFEKGTVSLLSVYSGMDANKLPPFAGSDHEFVSTLFWTTPQVKEKVSSILTSQVNIFTVKDSVNYNPVEAYFDTTYYSIKKNWYDDFELLVPEELQSYSFSFFYAGKPYLQINDGAQVIQPESSSIDWFPWFGINRLRTMYHISYPVIVSLKDPKTGYTMSFATEVNIRNNQPMSALYVPYDYSTFDEYQPAKTQFCDIDQRTSEQVSFKVINGKNGSAEPDVALTFVCGAEACPIARTNESGLFTGALPVCSGGQMQLLKDGFQKTYLQVSPSIDREIAIGSVPLEPFRIINATAKHISLVKNRVTDTWYPRSGTQSLHNSEEVIVQLNKVSLDNSGAITTDDFSTITVITANEPSEIRLLPGYYEGTLLGIVNEPLVFPPQERCVSYRKLFKKEKECFFVPNETVTMDSFTAGGVTFGPESFYMHVPRTDLDAASIIEFKEIFVDLYSVPEQDRMIEDLQQIQSIETYTAQYRKELQPTFR